MSISTSKVLRRGAIVCSECTNVLYKKSWKAVDDLSGFRANTPIEEGICPACEMSQNNLFEGEIVVDNIPTRYAAELYNLIRSYGQKAIEKDSQHRVLEVDARGHTYRVTTSENKLALRLAQRIQEVFHGLISWTPLPHSRAPHKVERLYLSFI